MTAPPGGGPRRRRRKLLRAGLAAAAAVVVTVTGLVTWWWSGADVNTAGKVRFTNRLDIPSLAPSHHDEAGRRVFDLRAGEGAGRFKPGPATPTWGINGDYLGPTLRAARGDKVMIHLRNDLAEPTTMHWHGMELPAVMDGGPHQVIKPGTTWSPTWSISQPAATLWYHPHPHGRTAEHVYRGLAGMFIVDDPQTSPAALPHRYGTDDIPLIVQDKRFGSGNQLSLGQSRGGTGILGDTILVNGTIAPYQEVTTEKVRLRVVNASNARVYNLGLSGDRPLTLIGTDGGLLPAPQAVSRVQLSPVTGRRSS
jgi:FtsP/CotA-like multicopper oxidase with cupredoxin domain